jgi:hypothetical protein
MFIDRKAIREVISMRYSLQSASIKLLQDIIIELMIIWDLNHQMINVPCMRRDLIFKKGMILNSEVF